jgi:DNA-directed RNA polymerase subunit RPC12/RpoP
MRVRCGACRTQFEVAGAGRFACPVCGSVNVVRNGPEQGVGGYPTAPGVRGVQPPSPAPPLPPPPPLPSLECPECGIVFIVGPISVAACPNCAAEVTTGFEEESE